MKILYYTWGECTYQGCLAAMRKKGWQVDLFSEEMSDLDFDDIFAEKLKAQMKEGYDAIFSFNYFPLISRVVQERDGIYISWVYDSPHLTLESVTLGNSCNRVYIFDLELYQRYLRKGIATVNYMPLAFNGDKIQQCLNGKDLKFKHDVCFLGNLYDNEYNFIDQIKYMPEFLKGFIDGVIAAQRLIYGYNLVENVFDEAMCDELSKYAHIDMGPIYINDKKFIFQNMINKKITVLERHQFLEDISKKYKLDLYATEKPKNLLLKYHGYVDYDNEMPVVFKTSKINLNITLRSIQSGIPLRVIDILGAGGFVLTNYQSELAEYFENGTHLVWYESEEDMIQKIEYYLIHDEEREQIARNGHERAKQIFSYDILLDEIFRNL